MDHQKRQPRFKPDVRVKWQRAMDELLIDAIFGDLVTIRRDADILEGHARGPVRAGPFRIAEAAALTV